MTVSDYMAKFTALALGIAEKILCAVASLIVILFLSSTAATATTTGGACGTSSDVSDAQGTAPTAANISISLSACSTNAGILIPNAEYGFGIGGAIGVYNNLNPPGGGQAYTFRISIGTGFTDFTVNGSTYTNWTEIPISGTTELTVQYVYNSQIYHFVFSADSATATTSGFTVTSGPASDTAPPVVQSIAVVGTPAADATSVDFLVTFNENANNITTDDFELTETDGATGNIASVSAASGTTVTVTVDTIAGNGTLRLDLKASTDIDDDADNTPPAAFTSGAVHTTNFDVTGPTVIISGVPASISGTTAFTAIYTFNEDVGTTFDISDVTAALTNASASAFTTITANTVFSVLITPTGAGDVSVGLNANAVQDSSENYNLAVTPEVATNTIVEDTQKVIASFMLNRASQILANQPDLIGFLEGTNSDGGGPLGYLGINGNDGNVEIAFSSSLSKVDRARAESLQQLTTRGGADAHNALTFAAETPHAAYGGGSAGNGYMPTRKYDIWTQIYGSTTHAGDSDSSFWIGYLGAHYFVTPDMIIGALVQLDWADEDNGSLGSSADGQGWMIGPYFAGRITGTGLNYEARASWGRSSNNVSPLGTYTDEFETERWLASFKLKGDYVLDMVTFRPSVSVSYFEEEQESYTDGLSNIIPSQTVSLGEVKFGPEFIRDFVLSDGSVFRPSIGISGVWNFGIEEGASPQGYALGNDDLRARLDVGFSLSNPHGMMMSVGAYYDGLAVDEYESMGGKVNVSVPIR